MNRVKISVSDRLAGSTVFPVICDHCRLGNYDLMAG